MRNPFFQLCAETWRGGSRKNTCVCVCVCVLGNGLIHSASTSTHKVTAKKDTRPRGATRRVIESPRESISCLTLRNEKSMLSRYPCNSSAAHSTKQGDGLLGGKRRQPKGRGGKCRENGDTSASQFRARQSYMLDKIFRSVTTQRIHRFNRFNFCRRRHVIERESHDERKV